MNKEDVLSKLNDIFRDVFDDEELVIDEYTTSETLEEWDSLEHISLIVEIENIFGVKFNMGEVNDMKKVDEICNLIMKKLESNTEKM